MKLKSSEDTLARAGGSALDTFERRPFEFSLHDSLNMSRQRRNMTRTRTNIQSTNASSNRDRLDFLDLVSLICDIYQTSLVELIPMQQFHPAWENEEDMGNSCIVTSRSISSSTPSGIIRGQTKTEGSKVIVKRTKKGIWQLQQYAAIHDLVTELRVRSHAPLRNNPYIVNLKGIAWDFENDDEEKPKPLLVEEFAPYRSLETFWERNNLRRMPFRIKASLCKDIAQGIKALHSCGIVHGDVKPGNILVFPFRSIRRPFMAKLTDFGHSVCEFEALECLPAWTPHWCAPEADQEASGMAPMTFRDMMATDVYSYGLVATSIMIGTSIFSKDFLGSDNTGSPAEINATNYIINRIMELVIHEDRVQLDSDFDLLVIHTLLNSTLQKIPSQRKSISDCIDIFSRYEETIYHSNQQSRSLSEYVPPYEVIQPVVARHPPIIGYRSLAKCSFLVKRKIVEELEKSSMEKSSQRRAACAWELCICYFSGFGVEKDWARARHWLTQAAIEGVRIAQAFYVRLNSAMAFSPTESLTMSPKISSNGQSQMMDANALLSEWLEYAVSVGCLDVLPDLQEVDKNIGTSLHIEATEKFRKYMAATIRLSKEHSDGSKLKSHESNLDSLLQVLRASVQGDLDFIQIALQSNPGAQDCFDSDGNTPLLLAAKYGNFDTVSFLLHHTSTNVGAFNYAQQNVLHFLPIFNDNEVETLVRTAVRKGADITQEGLPIVYSTEISSFNLSVRCCPLLNTIIRGSLTLLEHFLEACHDEENKYSCKICENGSRYRKIVAVSFALHCHGAITLLHKHLDRFNHGQGKDLTNIEIWHQEQLVPLYKVPLDGFSLRGMDLPEPFLRAIYHQERHKDALHETLDYLLPRASTTDDRTRAYEMILDSVDHDATDALSYLLSREFPNGDLLFFAHDTIGDFYNNPVFASIRLGFRHVFSLLARINGQNISEVSTKARCPRSCCERRKPPHRHRLNMAQLCLSAAVTASHCDPFFVDFILTNCSESLLTAQPAILDERLTGQPPAFMAQAISTNALKSAMSIAKKFPAVLKQKVPQILPDYRLKSSESYTSIADSIVLNEDCITPSMFMKLPDYIFLAGSSGNCQILQTIRIQEKRRLKESRSQQRPNGSVDFEMGDLESNQQDWDWRNHLLSAGELHWLLVGLIADKRKDRVALWSLVKHQFGLPKHKNMMSDAYYLKLAIMYSNHEAFEELLDMRETELSPLTKWSLLLLAVLTRELQAVYPLGVNNHQWTMLANSKITAEQKALPKKMVSVLEARGFKPSDIITFHRLAGVMIFTFVVFLLLLAGAAASSKAHEQYDAPFGKLYPFAWALGTLFNFIFVFAFTPSLPFRTPWACFGPRTFSGRVVVDGWFPLLFFCIGVAVEFVVVPSVYVHFPPVTPFLIVVNLIPFVLTLALLVFGGLGMIAERGAEKIEQELRYL